MGAGRCESARVRTTKMKRQLFLASVFLTMACDGAWAIYCGNSLVVEGQRKIDVLQRCGQPYFSDSHVIYRPSPVPAYGGIYGQGPDGRYNGSGSSVVIVPPVPVVIDEWVYNYGPLQFMPQLLFENGTLISIRFLGYGR